MNTKKTRGIFVTGTDTGVGKTLISGALARTLRNKAIHCGVMKPVESGCRTGQSGLIPQDGQYLKQAALSNEPIDQITPIRFKKPLSPYAAVLSGEAPKYAFSHIQKTAQSLLDRHQFLIIEGVGGLLAPLTPEECVIDMIKALQLPVLLVARSGLGTLNHTLLTLRYGESQGLSFIGVILNRTTAKADASEKTNLKILSERTPYPIWGPLPNFKTKGGTARIIEQSALIFEQNKRVNPLIQHLIHLSE